MSIAPPSLNKGSARSGLSPEPGRDAAWNLSRLAPLA